MSIQEYYNLFLGYAGVSGYGLLQQHLPMLLVAAGIMYMVRLFLKPWGSNS